MDFEDSRKILASVYNKYQKGDFSVGQDNLNPLREMGVETLTDLETFRQQMYAHYKSLIQEYLAKAQGTEYASQENLAPGDLGLPYENKVDASIPLTAWEGNATSTDNLKDDGSDSLSSMAFSLLQVLDAFLGGVPLGSDDLPFDICGDRVTSADSTTIAGTSGVSSTDISSLTTQTLTTAGSTDLACLMLELDTLKIIFVLLTFIKRVSMIERYLLAIAYPIIDIIVKVINAIINPAERRRVVMDLVGQVLSWSISWLFEYVQDLLGGIDLNCLAQSSLSSVREIMGTVQSTKDVGSEFKAFKEFNSATSRRLEAIKKKIEADQEKGGQLTAEEVFAEDISYITEASGVLLKDHFKGSFIAF